MSDLDIPIDIHSSKLLDWLLSRKHVKPDWTINLGAIQTKINAAVSDIPRNTDIACLLSGAYIHYFHCKDIANVLAGTEDGARNVFGGYSSKRMNDWMEIIKMYERNNVFIAECARLLSTSVYFDVPALRKKIQKLEQMQQDVEKRESELLKTHSVLEADFKAECDVLGIKGKNIREELLAIVPELMNIYSGVVEALHSIEPAVEVYKRFKNKRNVKVGLDVVRHILEFGNTTVYQFIHCKEPKRVVSI
ncbi:CDK5 regulatory subunit-associated protein 3 [Ctenocephalides felis]|uniref:CDK5 regulatory subunit-associated protein 3 n=1 Tax=Ctenocephalides felis TaxID=7515 RepID=UPI000E6E1559|nr:CDK5 regulatory subunit-associated protein 3 [Ctenocephalides felis]